MNAAIAQQEDPYAFIDGLNAGENLIVGNEAFSRLAAMIKLDFENCESPLNTDFSTQVSKFGSGTAAMACGGTWNHPTLDDVDPSMETGLIPMPFMTEEKDNDVLYAGVTTYWVINKDSSVKEAALQNTYEATCYPSGSALACSWSPALAQSIGSSVAIECKARGIGLLLGPGMNIRRHPLTARNFEYYSEDPAADWDAHHKLAQKAACECAVLLKNEDSILPVSPDSGRTIAV